MLYGDYIFFKVTKFCKLCIEQFNVKQFLDTIIVGQVGVSPHGRTTGAIFCHSVWDCILPIHLVTITLTLSTEYYVN